ncbi:delta(1)-pyrroline-2-carboxylate reductase family protein [Noviherbaspirillum galbum]|uniref:Delta(1)-pyrroline-2-carboxylate reductase family protein n=1 Tax=Noviherbaspirillum galbum TaxID=2709383 RepID=A0A6B3SVQ2_9BURK|nr:delta(1)-pyrroline-2-carboxylate reductase family protein [Noviherbaspirillum galbum]NEX64608.1 delta(1)-pyrroline-2-carboxylate reductase family protein [Noviherbaspirillum galbum]
MQILDSSRTAAALPYSRLVPAVARAAVELANGTITAPDRQVVTIDPASVLLSMPAIGSDISVTKLITVHAGNARHGLPAIQGEVVVFETATGRRLALLDGPTVTARRTAAVTLLGIDTLAPRKPASALIIGTGTQAAAHADALIDYFGVREFHIAARTQDSAARFGETLASRRDGANLRITAHAAAAIQQDPPPTDVIIALTTSSVPVIPAAIAPGTLAIGVGAFKPNMAEFPPALLHGRQIIVDDLDGARHEAGDLIQAGVDWDKVARLADVLSGKVSCAPAVPVFKTVGQAAWDLAAARVAIASMA